MGRPRFPITAAVRWLRSKGIDFKPFLYAYTEHGGARQAAEALRLDEHRVIKTLVMAPDGPSLLLVLMHGDQDVSTQRLARLIGAKRVHPVQPEQALQATGYQVGGISPFGIRKNLPIFVQTTILDLLTIYINGGKRGFLIELEPAVLLETLRAVPVDVANAAA